ncbi:hypothetical protein LJC46_09600 [Desulfovibrio sp. OttesenSCG-928-G15]|nr:hypothetical protein [Desulfovibrio sp. OttesenSCG-928-G15]
MPHGWEARALAGRLIAAGACTYPDLVSGKISMSDFFTMLQILDWNDHAREKARALAQAGRETGL